jgi:hypothetical protein
MKIAGKCEISIITIRVGYHVLIAGVVASFCLVGMACGVTLASQNASIDRKSML